MRRELWFDKKNMNNVFFIVHDAFISFIIDSMYACYIANFKEKELDIVIFFKKEPSKLDINLLRREVIQNIEDNMSRYGINKVVYRNIVLETTFSNFIEKEGKWINKYLPVFLKYEFKSYDLLD